MDFNFDLVHDYGDREDLMAEWDDLYPDSEHDDFLDGDDE